MSDDIPELTPAQFDSAISRRRRERLMRGEIRDGDDIRTLRKFLGLTQEAFAAALGISVGTLRNWEQGRRRPNDAAIALLKDAARSPTRFLARGDDPEAPPTGDAGGVDSGRATQTGSGAATGSRRSATAATRDADALADTRAEYRSGRAGLPEIGLPEIGLPESPGPSRSTREPRTRDVGRVHRSTRRSGRSSPPQRHPQRWRDCLERSDLLDDRLLDQIRAWNWRPRRPERKAAWDLYVDLAIRWATDPLRTSVDSERAALELVRSLVPATGDVLKNNGPECQRLSFVVLHAVHGVVQPFTTRWRRRCLDEALAEPNGRTEFHRDFSALRTRLCGYSNALAEIAQVETALRVAPFSQDPA